MALNYHNSLVFPKDLSFIYNNHYHVTRTASRAVSLENHKRKGPVLESYVSKWYGRKNTYGTTRNVYSTIDVS